MLEQAFNVRRPLRALLLLCLAANWIACRADEPSRCEAKDPACAPENTESAPVQNGPTDLPRPRPDAGPAGPAQQPERERPQAPAPEPDARVEPPLPELDAAVPPSPPDAAHAFDSGCAAGAHWCDGALLKECVQGRWSLKDECESAEQCSERGACMEPTCARDSYVCEGNELRRCNPQQSGYERVRSCGAGLCDAAGKQCDVCMPNSDACEGGSVVKSCDASGQKLTRSACPAERPLCKGDGRCVQCAEARECVAPVCKVARCDAAAGNCAFDDAPRGSKCEAGVCDGRGRCIGCIANGDCAKEAPICNAGSCIQCLTTEDCGERQACEGGRCVITEPSCGDGVVDWDTEQCEPPDSWTCNKECQTEQIGVYETCTLWADDFPDIQGTCGTYCHAGSCRATKCTNLVATDTFNKSFGTCTFNAADPCGGGCPTPPGSAKLTALCTETGCRLGCTAESTCPYGQVCMAGRCELEPAQ